MILDTVAVKLNSPESILPYPSCPSGVIPEQKTIYTHGYQPSQYPILIIPNRIYDNEGNSIADGYYTVALSDDKKFLLLIQSSRLKAKLPVYSLVEEQLTREEVEEENALKQKMEEARLKNKKKKYEEYKLELKKFYDRKQAKMSAEIRDSGKGHYIVIYKNSTVTAKGFFLK